MSIETPNSDSDLMDLLRIAGPLSVLQLATRWKLRRRRFANGSRG